MRRGTRRLGRKNNKYGNKITHVKGVRFDSKEEAMYYRGLLADKEKGHIQEIHLQPRYELQPKFEKGGVKFGAINYVADFLIVYPDGREEIIDVKGKETEVFKIKRKMFEYKYPNLRLKVVDV